MYFLRFVTRPKHPITVADPGFPQDGGANPPGGANIRFCQFFTKTAWNWKNLDLGASLMPPLQCYSQSCQPHGSQPFHDLTGNIPSFHHSNPEAFNGRTASGGGSNRQLFWEWPLTKEPTALWIALLDPPLYNYIWKSVRFLEIKIKYFSYVHITFQKWSILKIHSVPDGNVLFFRRCWPCIRFSRKLWQLWHVW